VVSSKRSESQYSAIAAVLATFREFRLAERGNGNGCIRRVHHLRRNAAAFGVEHQYFRKDWHIAQGNGATSVLFGQHDGDDALGD
jgi:hypothetical protein